MNKRSYCQAENDGYTCTKELNHGGNHVAHSNEQCTQMAHQWPRYQKPNVMAPCGHMKPHDPGYPTGNGPCKECDKSKEPTEAEDYPLQFLNPKR